MNARSLPRRPDLSPVYPVHMRKFSRCIAAAISLGVAGAAAADSISAIQIRGLSPEMEANVRLGLSLGKLLGRDLGEQRLDYLLLESERETRRALEPFGYFSPEIRITPPPGGAGPLLIEVTPGDEISIPEIVFDPEHRFHVAQVDPNRYAAALPWKDVKGLLLRRKIVGDSLVHDSASHINDDFLLHAGLRRARKNIPPPPNPNRSPGISERGQSKRRRALTPHDSGPYVLGGGFHLLEPGADNPIPARQVRGGGPFGWRRRQFVVDARYQLRSGMLVGAVAIVLLVLLNASLILPQRAASATVATAVAPGRAPFGAPDRSSFALLLMGSAVFLGGVVVVGLLESHRTAGAAFAIRRVVDGIRDGESQVRVQLRRGDHLQDLARSINQLAETIDMERLRRG